MLEQLGLSEYINYKHQILNSPSYQAKFVINYQLIKAERANLDLIANLLKKVSQGAANGREASTNSQNLNDQNKKGFRDWC